MLMLRDLPQFLGSAWTIVGLVLITAGVALAFLARRLTRAIHNTNDVPDNDKLFNTLKVLGMVLVGVGFLLIAIYVVIYLASK